MECKNSASYERNMTADTADATIDLQEGIDNGTEKQSFALVVCDTNDLKRINVIFFSVQIDSVTTE